MKHIPRIEKDGYMICSTQDSILETKISGFSDRIGSGERMISFGEFQVYGVLTCEGQFEVQPGTPYEYILNRNVLSNMKVYGIVRVEGEITLNAELIIL